jgi:hypothetical protein
MPFECAASRASAIWMPRSSTASISSGNRRIRFQYERRMPAWRVEEQVTGTAAGVAKSCFTSLSRRYRDAYGVAEGTVKFGKSLQRSSVIVTTVLGLVTVSYQGFRSYHWELDVSWWTLLASLLVTVIVGGIIYISGTRIASQGQFLLAMLDTAVNTSPHLKDSEKASIMSL